MFSTPGEGVRATYVIGLIGILIILLLGSTARQQEQTNMTAPYQSPISSLLQAEIPVVGVKFVDATLFLFILLGSFSISRIIALSSESVGYTISRFFDVIGQIVLIAMALSIVTYFGLLIYEFFREVISADLASGMYLLFLVVLFYYSAMHPKWLEDGRRILLYLWTVTLTRSPSQTSKTFLFGVALLVLGVAVLVLFGDGLLAFILVVTATYPMTTSYRVGGQA